MAFWIMSRSIVMPSRSVNHEAVAAISSSATSTGLRSGPAATSVVRPSVRAKTAAPNSASRGLAPKIPRPRSQKVVLSAASM